MRYENDLRYIKAELARDGRSLEFLIDIIDAERAIKEGKSSETISGLIQKLQRKRAKSTKRRR